MKTKKTVMHCKHDQSQNVVPCENLHQINLLQLQARIPSQKNTRALKVHLRQPGCYDHVTGEIQFVCQTAILMIRNFNNLILAHLSGTTLAKYLRLVISFQNHFDQGAMTLGHKELSFSPALPFSFKSLNHPPPQISAWFPVLSGSTWAHVQVPNKVSLLTYELIVISYGGGGFFFIGFIHARDTLNSWVFVWYLVIECGICNGSGSELWIKWIC